MTQCYKLSFRWQAYNNRGIEKAELGDYAGAIADYTKAIKINPEHAKAYYNRGVAFRKIGKEEDATQI